MKNLILAIILPFFGLVATAQQATFIDLGVVEGYRVAVGSGTNAQRIGNAVLTYVHRHGIDNSFALSSPVLFGCDGSWIDTLEATGHEKLEWSPKAYEAKARAASFNSVQSPIEINDWNLSSLFFAKKLRSHVNTICKSAAAEPRNVQIPLSVYPEDGNTPGGVGALLSGSLSRKGSVIDLWMRHSFFKLNVQMVDGSPWVVNGVEQKFREPTGAYEMRRSAFDCFNRRMAGP